MVRLEALLFVAIQPIVGADVPNCRTRLRHMDARRRIAPPASLATVDMWTVHGRRSRGNVHNLNRRVVHNTPASLIVRPHLHEPPAVPRATMAGSRVTRGAWGKANRRTKMNAQLRRPMALIAGVIRGAGHLLRADGRGARRPADGAGGWHIPDLPVCGAAALHRRDRHIGTRHVYCIEAGKAAELSYSQEVALADTDQARRVAWLAEEYRESRDARIHAGIGVLAHRYFDLDANAWQAHWAAIQAQHPDLARTADELWNQAGQSMPASTQASYAYEEGLRSGTVSVGVKNSSGRHGGRRTL